MKKISVRVTRSPTRKFATCPWGLKKTFNIVFIADGDNAKRLEPRHYLTYGRALKAFGLKVRYQSKVFEMGTTAHPDSMKLWHARLKLYINNSGENDVATAFWQAVEGTKDVPADQVVRLWCWVRISPLGCINENENQLPLET